MDMGMLNEEERYQLFQIFRENGVDLTEAQKQFMMDHAQVKLTKLLEDPGVMAVFKRLADK